jgi:hypothetical protein
MVYSTLKGFDVLSGLIPNFGLEYSLSTELVLSIVEVLRTGLPFQPRGKG